MEPRQAGSGISSEQAPRQPEFSGTPEYGGLGNPEIPNVSPEHARQPQEVAPSVPLMAPVLPMPIVVQDDDTVAESAVAQDSPYSAVAADEDLIEKEWVDKAKKIIEDTKDDPYRREQEVGRLQREYIKKRYGRDIGESKE